MKKIITFVLVTIAAASAVCYSNLTPAKEIGALTMANIEALSSAGEDLMATCTLWCTYSPKETCVLITNAGFNINCVGMRPN